MKIPKKPTPNGLITVPKKTAKKVVAKYRSAHPEVAKMPVGKEVCFELPGGEYILVRQGKLESNLKTDEPDQAYYDSIDGIESLLLALASNGVNIGTKAFRDAVGLTVATLVEQKSLS